MRRTMLLIAFTALTLLMATGVALAQATTETQTDTYDIGGGIADPCTGEFISFDGVQTYIAHSTQDSAGNTHIFFRVITKGSGINPVTGDKFLYRDAGGQQEFTATAGTPTVFTPQATGHVISLGATPDFLFHANYRFTVDDEGNLDIQLENIRYECTGQTEPQL